MERTFVVVNAGCSSCAELVRSALEPLAAVSGVEIDESADTATVTLTGAAGVAEDSVNAALSAASAGGGHEYRVQPGSWGTA